MTITIDHIKAVEYHRNGICGIGFYVCDFSFSDDYSQGLDARAVVFENGDGMPDHYAVTTSDPSEKWRGDHFIDLLWPEIRKAMDAKWDELIARHRAA
jgi:hypothetical protein